MRIKQIILTILGTSLIFSCSSYARNVSPIETPSQTNTTSTNILPPNASTTTPYSPGVTTPTPPNIIGANYPTTSCPGNPSDPAQTGKPPICPDINGKYPTGYTAATANCPDVCVTTNYVAPNYVSATEAICPAGYTQTSTFNMKPEVAPNDPNATYFPTSYSDMTTHQNQGWDCTGSNGTGIWCMNCRSTGNDTLPNSVASGTWIGLPDLPGRYGPVYATNNIKVSSGRKYWVEGNGNSSNCGNKEYKAGCPAGTRANAEFYYNYTSYTCKPKPNTVHVTGQYVPYSKVCSRLKPIWIPANK